MTRRARARTAPVVTTSLVALVTVPLVVALATAALVAPGAVPAADAVRPAWSPAGPPAWSDEFDGPAGSAPDPSRWRAETGGSGWGNDELQYYTDSRANAALDGDGHLVITARAETPPGATCWYGTCAYTSARLITAGLVETTYGHVEARLRIPGGQGTWPAFWMLGTDVFTTAPWPASGEIDVMENVGHEPGLVWGSLHLPGRSGADAVHASTGLPGGEAFADDFHVYAVDWAPGSIAWSVDGVVYQRRTPADTGGTWPFEHPFFLILNLAVGGGWPGSPDATTPWPRRMVVDHVRVYAGPPGGTLTAP
ncbi:beta-glucanase (GH16 family) [Sediminihabitans luteus]|uniref:Beta-glucanase (GH16 family) n=1 Tax=Sediminihabitans luteus TaxID=1138585 RepID=A0A2M9CYZ2_9CELL|nr:glycoside hydrolase family 16 protein [Sediminihabitans luteus]PJJ77130.1 beta-glucanase (GH16 family) [Sediminihabitans luteus]GII98578.1 hypothetical protein Slu03_09560 [Sediminihabitans luteus]